MGDQEREELVEQLLRVRRADLVIDIDDSAKRQSRISRFPRLAHREMVSARVVEQVL